MNRSSDQNSDFLDSMDSKKIKNLLASVKDGNISIEDALKKLKHLPYEDISFAKVDHHRHLRQGVPEVIYAQVDRKTGGVCVPCTKSRIFISNEKALDALRIRGAVFYPVAGIIAVGEEKKKTGDVLILTAGTSDIPVAEEAAVTASFLGSKVRSYDVGVASPLNGCFREMRKARIVVAGGGASVCRGRHDRQTNCCCADIYRIWHQPRRTDRALCDAQFLRPRHSGHEYRQRLRRRMPGAQDKHPRQRRLTETGRFGLIISGLL
jgi:hypothetical protein